MSHAKDLVRLRQFLKLGTYSLANSTADPGVYFIEDDCARKLRSVGIQSSAPASDREASPPEATFASGLTFFANVRGEIEINLINAAQTVK